MTDTTEACPQYPANEGLIISGDPAPSVPAPSAEGRHAICASSQGVAPPGDLEDRATGDTLIVGHPGSQESLASSGPSSSSTRQFQGSSRPPRKNRGGERKLRVSDEPVVEPPSSTKDAPPPVSPRTGRDSSSDAVRAQEPEACAATSAERMDEGVPKGEGAAKAAGDSKKRRAAFRPRPAKKANKPNHSPQEGAQSHLSFRDAVTDDKLVGVVVNKSNLLAQFSDDVIQTTRNDVIAKIREAVDRGDSFIPHFEQSGGIQGRLHVSCADEDSLQWLIETVGSLKHPTDESVVLGVVSPKEIPKLTRVEMWVPGPLRSDAQLLSLLQGQNRGLVVERWKRYHIKEGDKGQYYVWGVDPDSLAVLESLQFKPYYEMSRLTTWLAGRRSKSGRQSETE